jgi:hypothetical protein
LIPKQSPLSSVYTHDGKLARSVEKADEFWRVQISECVSIMKRRPSRMHSHPAAAHADHPSIPRRPPIHPSPTIQPTNQPTHPCSDPCLYRRSHAACVYFGGPDRSTKPKRRARKRALLSPPLLLYCSRAPRATRKRLCQSANNNNSCLMARRPAGIFPARRAAQTILPPPHLSARQLFTSGISQRLYHYKYAPPPQ